MAVDSSVTNGVRAEAVAAAAGSASVELSAELRAAPATPLAEASTLTKPVDASGPRLLTLAVSLLLVCSAALGVVCIVPDVAPAGGLAGAPVCIAARGMWERAVDWSGVESQLVSSHVEQVATALGSPSGAKSGGVKSGGVKSGGAKSGRVKSGRVKSDGVKSGGVKSGRVKSGGVKSDGVGSSSSTPRADDEPLEAAPAKRPQASGPIVA